ncbi:MAG: phospholipase D-like domain-containing protein [Candidatus Micrarchaeaceae archaeon]
MPESGSVSYSGSESYKYVEPLIQGGKRIWIISPYIGKYYAEMLRKYTGHRDVRVITTDAPENEEGILAISSRGSGRSRTLLGFALLMVLFLLVSYFYAMGFLMLAFTVLFVILMYYAIKEEAAKSPIKLRLAKGKFVHEKIYIGSGIAIVGSANLTYNGMHKNIEHIEIIREGGRIAELEKHFSQLWNASDKA